MSTRRELGWAWRFSAEDSAYGLGFRPCPGSAQAEGWDVGRTFRLEGRWSDGDGLALVLGFERLEASADLRDAGLSGGGFAFASVTFRW